MDFVFKNTKNVIKVQLTEYNCTNTDDLTDTSRLPTTSTCSMVLYLPIYPTKEIFNEKMNMALNNLGGFELA